MPLDRQHMTVASRVMLPRYVVFFTAVASNYLFTPLGRLLDSPGLAYANELMSLRLWGVAFLAAALAMFAALLRHERDLFRAALLFCRLGMLVWAVVLALAAILGDASPTAWAWPWLIEGACKASYRSLTAQEVT
jgi:CDP-diglyceride synthetase